MSTARAARRNPTATDIDADPGRLAGRSTTSLAATDPQLYELLAADIRHQHETLSLLASASIAPPAVLACAGSAIANVATHGYPGRRLEAGSEHFDVVERLAADRAKAAFGASYANVQPYSSSSANLSIYLGLLRPGDTIMALDAAWGGQGTHGSPLSITGRNYNAVSYGLNGVGRIDYDRLRQIARRCRPQLIVCSVGAYPRTPDFARFRAIANEVGAYLLADISQVAALVAAGAHPNPVDYAHVTTCCTSLLGGPRGGLILLGADAESPVCNGSGCLRRAMNAAVYPLTQGAPNPAAIAAKAAAFGQITTPTFRQMAHRSVANAKELATRLLTAGHEVLTNGTDNHMVLLNVMGDGTTGLVAERALAACGILTSRNRVPFDVKPAQVGSGIRLGTQALAMRGMTPREMDICADLVDEVLRAVIPRSDTEYSLPETVQRRVKEAVRNLCRAFPLAKYTTPDQRSGAQLSTA
jgi:glycine hydroxymethyltransferase